MNYYEHHLGDYLRDTAHLSMLEDGAYRRLLDAYYIREVPLPAEIREVFRLVRAQSKQDRDAVQTVLREFFQLTDAGWTHHRCAREIERFRSKSEKARASIRSRWEKVRAVPHDVERSNNERNTNVSTDGYERSTDVVHRAPVPRHQTPDTIPSEATLLRGSARGARLPAAWEPGEAGMAFAAQQGLVNGRAQSELAKFRDHWAAKTGADARKADWAAVWRNWVRRAVEFGGSKGSADQSDAEPEWRREQRERNEAVLGPYAAKKRHPPETIDMEAPDATARIVD